VRSDAPILVLNIARLVVFLRRFLPQATPPSPPADLAQVRRNYHIANRIEWI